METLYLVSAIVGGTVLLCQFLLSVLGAGDHHDVDAGHDFHGGEHLVDGHDTSRLVGVLSLQTIAAALTIFGLSGMAATGQQMTASGALLVGLGGAAGTVLLVSWTMGQLYQLKADGTARIERSIGKCGTVYLTIPEKRSGIGKVTLSLQNRTVEFQAVTAQEKLPTGAKVVIVNVISSDTVEVAPAEPERNDHVQAAQ